jgi:hypothetical protein
MLRERLERERRISVRDVAPALLLCGLALVIVAGFPWPCPLKMLTGYPCPTCGMTRAARFALHGDWAGATHVHPLWMIVLPACTVVGIAECVGFARTRQWGTTPRLPGARGAGTVIVAALVVVWIARFFGAFGGPVVG